MSASPVVTFGDQALLEQEKEYFSKRQDLPVRLFISVGSLEPLSYPVQSFVKVLDERNYKDLIWTSMVIDGEQHAGNKPEAYNRGLRFIFQGK